MKKTYKIFWDRFDPKLYRKVLQSKQETKVMVNVRIGKTLNKDFDKKIKSLKKSKIKVNKTDVVLASIVEFTYKNELTTMEAIMIIAKKDSSLAEAAKFALESKDGIVGFVNYISDQCDQGNKETLIGYHGEDVIETILKSKP